jgi:hypothetical protein
MLKTFKISFFLILTIISLGVYSQGEIDDQPKVMLKNEKTGFVFLTSNGYGASYRYGKRINARNQTLYDIDFMNVKHPKELRLTSSYNAYSSRSFVYGKKNLFWELKGSIGKQYELYRKNDKGGISIRYYYLGGLTLGILKPIYYEIQYYSLNYNYVKEEKFNISIHQSNINGKASFFKGFDELSLKPGLTAKGGFSFEFGRDDKIIRALDVGIGLDLFPRSIPIMATQTNNFFFINLTAGYRFGKIIDVSDAAHAKNWKTRREEKILSRDIAREQKGKEKDLQDY